jgi:hypothetical protein
LQSNHTQESKNSGAVQPLSINRHIVTYAVAGTGKVRPTLDAIILVVFGLAWLGFGLFMLLRPDMALHNTQWPWTRLPRWGMRLVGLVVLFGAGWMLYLSTTKFHH